MSGTGYPYGATGYDPETRKYSWDPAPCGHCGRTDHDTDHCPGQGA